MLVTGLGIISALGESVEKNHDALRNGSSGIQRAKHFESNYADKLLFGEVKFSDEALRSITGTKDQLHLSRTTLLAFHAFAQAIHDAGLNQTELSAFGTAFISSSTVGGMCHTDQLYSDANNKNKHSQYIKSYEFSDHTKRLAEAYQIKGITNTINTACSSSANAIQLGARLIHSGRAKRVIVGGADALSKFSVNGFNSLRILSQEHCKPFDRDRNGLNLGEGAAYIVLESEEVAANKKIYAALTAFGNASDAFHPSATSDQATGPVKAMKAALEMSEISPDDIHYINAHGTGTENNDITESYAFSAIFKKPPPYNSTKSYTGHTLAAAGVIESIYTLLSIYHAELYPSLNVKNKIPEYGFEPIRQFQKGLNIQHAITNSFGFGGNCTSLIFSKCT